MARRRTSPEDQVLALFRDGVAPEGLRVDGKLDLTKLSRLASLPARLACYELNASGTQLETVPSDLQVECSLVLDRCKRLTSLPRGLRVGTLSVANCPRLTELPERLDAWFVNAPGCPRLAKLPRSCHIRHGGLNLHGCTSLGDLPDSLEELATLDVGDCPLLTGLPERLRITGWVEVAGSGLAGLPPSLRDAGIRWRGVSVDYRTAFQPDELAVGEVLKERNAERRRVMIERMGFSRFMTEAKAKKLDEDRDPGGARQLLRVALPGDEDIVSLSVFCPSTGRHYLLRVPPTMKTCHQAAAWMAGFDDPAKYRPIKET